MKKLISFFVLFLMVIWQLVAQAGLEGFNYQAVLRDIANQPIKNQAITVTFKLSNTPGGTVLYSENQQASTDALGLFNLIIGENNSNFSNLNWGSNEKYLEVVVDVNGNVIPMGTTRFQAVPYAKYALSAPASQPIGIAGGDLKGTYPNPTVNAIQNQPVSTTIPSNGQVLKWDAANNQWKADTDNGQNYNAGPGLLINGNVITNIGDINAADDITNSSIAAGDVSGTFYNLKIDSNSIGSIEIKNGSIKVEDLDSSLINRRSDSLWALNGTDINNTNSGKVKIVNTAEIFGSAPNLILNNGSTNSESRLTFLTPNSQFTRNSTWDILRKTTPTGFAGEYSSYLVFRNSFDAIKFPKGGFEHREYEPLILNKRSQVEIHKYGNALPSLLLSSDSTEGYSNIIFKNGLDDASRHGTQEYEFRDVPYNNLGKYRTFEFNELNNNLNKNFNIFTYQPKLADIVANPFLNFNLNLGVNMNEFREPLANLEIIKKATIDKNYNLYNLMLSSDDTTNCNMEFNGNHIDGYKPFYYEFTSKPTKYIGDGKFDNKFLFQKNYHGYDKYEPIFEFNDNDIVPFFSINPKIIGNKGLYLNESDSDNNEAVINIRKDDFTGGFVETVIKPDSFIFRKKIFGLTEQAAFSIRGDQLSGSNGIASFEFGNPIIINQGIKRTNSFAYFALTGNTPIFGFDNGTFKYSLVASNRVLASEFNAFSDKRIKKVIGISNSNFDLQTLMQLKVTDYTHLDIAAKGKEVKKGFIAQEIEQVFPESVSKSTDFIPNIYKVAKSVKVDPLMKSIKVIMNDTIQLKNGEIVKLIADKTYEKEIDSVDSHSFIIKDWDDINTKEVFVYGVKVNDFRTVDYDRIFTLNVSATQELMKQVELLKNQIGVLEANNLKLSNKYEQLESNFSSILNKLENVNRTLSSK